MPLPKPHADCPCESGRSYADCCAPWHAGLAAGAHAPTPEALMRSRYSAYVAGLIDYLLATWHPSTAPGELELWPVKWLGLEVRHTEAGGDAGIVEFVARHRDSSGRAQRLHELSRFVRENGRWYYIDGQDMNPRADPWGKTPCSWSQFAMYAQWRLALTLAQHAHRILQHTLEPEHRMPTETATATRPAGAVNTLAGFKVVPTGAAVGAEILGMDLSLPIPGDVGEALRKAWAQHMVIYWRGQKIDDDQLMAVSAVFGPPHTAAARKYHLAQGESVDDEYMISRHPSVSIISNIGKDGKPVMDNGGLGSYEVVWHSDNSYVQTPPAGSMLYSLVVPVNGGGDTSFNNQYLAYEELPDELKKAIEGKSQVHDSSRNSAGVLRPGVKPPTKPEEVEGPAHPLVRVHPVTGKRALFLGRRRVWPSNYIIGMSNADSEALLDKLWAHATQEKYAWTHYWKVGDCILWDNRCCMHYRTEVDVTQRRIMHRTTIKGELVQAPW